MLSIEKFINQFNITGIYPFNLSEIINNDERIKELLAFHLYDGQIALVLGAGVSKEFGFPKWRELVDGMYVEYCGSSEINEKTDSVTLQKYMDNLQKKIKDKTKFHNLLEKVLYQNVDYNRESEILKNDLLISLGSFMMGSQNGSVNTVITYNYDDLLEWYLELHGFNVRIVHNPRAIKTNCDVTIYHPHGFLPLKNGYQRSKDIILSKSSYIFREHSEEITDGLWENLLNRIFIEHICIFIGISGEFETMYKRFLRIYNKKIDRKRPIGYFFYHKEIKQDKINEMLECGIIPIIIKSKYDIPSFLLDIRQKAILLSK